MAITCAINDVIKVAVKHFTALKFFERQNPNTSPQIPKLNAILMASNGPKNIAKIRNDATNANAPRRYSEEKIADEKAGLLRAVLDVAFYHEAFEYGRDALIMPC